MTDNGGPSPYSIRVPTVRIEPGQRIDAEEVVVREAAATIVFNNKELVTLLCSPEHLDHLAIGFLVSEGLLESRDEIQKLIVDDRNGIVWVDTAGDREVDPSMLYKRLITSGCGRGASFTVGQAPEQLKIESKLSIAADEIANVVQKFQHYSDAYRSTHGVHSAALCQGENILIFKDDIGRHNAIDKMFGECLLKDIPSDEHAVIISGRVSSEMLFKVAKRRVPIVVSIAVPTDVGVNWAVAMDMTLVGRVRGARMNVYSGAWRITS